MKNSKIIKVSIPYEIKKSDLLSLLDSAFRYSPYWYMDDIRPNKQTSKKRDEADRFFEDVLNHGFKIKLANNGIRAVKPSEYPVAIILLSQKYPDHFAKFISGEADQYTADVFLQLLVFRKVKYG